jgi:hypothetical protein
VLSAAQLSSRLYVVGQVAPGAGGRPLPTLIRVSGARLCTVAVVMDPAPLSGHVIDLCWAHLSDKITLCAVAIGCVTFSIARGLEWDQ